MTRVEGTGPHNTGTIRPSGTVAAG